jgi:hypothetical protein
MTKQTKMLLAVGVVGVAAYYYFKSKKTAAAAPATKQMVGNMVGNASGPMMAKQTGMMKVGNVQKVGSLNGVGNVQPVGSFGGSQIVGTAKHIGGSSFGFSGEVGNREF